MDHNTLYEKLSYYGINGSELALFKSYLENRRQYVQINASCSSVEAVQYGVPQGSVLGPLLFKLYINDISNLELSGKLYMYADDICILYPYKENLILKLYAERDAALITEYARLNKLILNASKTKFVRFRPQQSHNNEICTISVNGESVSEVGSTKYLGVTLQSNLSWSLHIQQLKSKIAPVLGLLYKLKNKLKSGVKYMIFQALIQSQLNYLALIYGYKKNTTLKSLQIMQNKALKLIYNLPHRFSTTLLYRSVAHNVLPVYGLYKMQLLVYVYKVTHNIGHHSLHFARIQHTFNTRNCSNLATRVCRLELTKQKIEYMGSVEYNNLPGYIKESETISTFKNRLYLVDNVEMLLI